MKNETTLLIEVNFTTKQVEQVVELANRDWEHRFVDSSCIQEVFYNEDEEEMILKFSGSNRYYSYSEVCRYIFEDIFDSGRSIGYKYQKNKSFIVSNGVIAKKRLPKVS